MTDTQKPIMNTMTDCTNSLVKQGYTENFQIEEGKLKALSDDQLFEANEITITNFYRFEGKSDPDDNAIVYAIETSDGKKGMLIDAYGVNADSDITEFIQQVSDISKKQKT